MLAGGEEMIIRRMIREDIPDRAVHFAFCGCGIAAPSLRGSDAP